MTLNCTGIDQNWSQIDEIGGSWTQIKEKLFRCNAF